MGRSTGPVCKLCRRENTKLYLKGARCDSPKCALAKRPYPPGKSGPSRRKASEYGIRLREKQKARRFYGLSEDQFRATFEKAALRKGIKGENFLIALEMRLDNVVARLGFAPTRRQARQLIRHGHIQVDGKRVDIPSFHTKVDQVISIKDPAKGDFAIQLELISKQKPPAWLSFSEETKEGKIIKFPEREEMDVPVNEQLIVEYYSR